MEIIRLNAGNDRNGNPRRVFVCIEAGEIVATYDEGYKGLGALPKSIRGHWRLGPTFPTTATEYLELVQIEGDSGGGQWSDDVVRKAHEALARLRNDGLAFDCECEPREGPGVEDDYATVLAALPPMPEEK